MKRVGFLLLALSSILFACKSNKTRFEIVCDRKTITSEQALAASAGNAVVIAEILKIYDQRLDYLPCSKVPCMALIKIEVVEKNGSNFMKPLTVGLEGKMRFTFSLNETTKELFPNLDKRLPGLKVGNRFKVNVGEEQLLGSNESQWVAYDYILLN